jgi:hypothetical protein
MSYEFSMEILTGFDWVLEAEFCECSDHVVFVKGEEVIDQLRSCEFFKRGVCYYAVECGDLYIC